MPIPENMAFKKRKDQVSIDSIAEYQIQIIATCAYFLPSLLRVHLCLACQSSWSPTRTTGWYGLSNLTIDRAKLAFAMANNTFRCSDKIAMAELLQCHLSMNSSLVTSWTLILWRLSGTWTMPTCSHTQRPGEQTSQVLDCFHHQPPHIWWEPKMIIHIDTFSQEASNLLA